MDKRCPRCQRSTHKRITDESLYGGNNYVDVCRTCGIEGPEYYEEGPFEKLLKLWANEPSERLDVCRERGLDEPGHKEEGSRERRLKAWSKPPSGSSLIVRCILLASRTMKPGFWVGVATGLALALAIVVSLK